MNTLVMVVALTAAMLAQDAGTTQQAGTAQPPAAPAAGAQTSSAAPAAAQNPTAPPAGAQTSTAAPAAAQNPAGTSQTATAQTSSGAAQPAPPVGAPSTHPETATSPPATTSGPASAAPSPAATTGAPAPSAPSAAPAQTAATSAPPASATATVLQVALLRLEGNKAAADEAPGVTSLLASRLAESPNLRVITQEEIAALLGVERQKRLLNAECSSDSCMTELAGALGSRYLVTGRLDRFGEKYVLTTTVFDSQRTVSLAKPHTDVDDAEELPQATTKIAKEIEVALGVAKESFLVGPEPGGPSRFSLSFRAGSSFFSDIMALAPSGDVEFGFRFAQEWMALLQVGFKPVRTGENTVGFGAVNLVPSLVGVRKLYRTEHSFQPYWGLGIGIQLAIGDLGIFSRTGPLPSVWAIGGFQYMFTPRFGLLLEGKSNLAQATLGFAGNSQYGNGFNIDLSAGVAIRF